MIANVNLRYPCILDILWSTPNSPPQHPTADFDEKEWQILHPKRRKRLLAAYRKAPALYAAFSTAHDPSIVFGFGPGEHDLTIMDTATAPDGHTNAANTVTAPSAKTDFTASVPLPAAPIEIATLSTLEKITIGKISSAAHAPTAATDTALSTAKISASDSAADSTTQIFEKIIAALAEYSTTNFLAPVTTPAVAESSNHPEDANPRAPLHLRNAPPPK